MVDAAAPVAAALARPTSPTGFTVAELREALRTSRKYALPLAALLDARGITRARGRPPRRSLRLRPRR